MQKSRCNRTCAMFSSLGNSRSSSRPKWVRSVLVKRDPLQDCWLSEFANSLSRSFPFECKMRDAQLRKMLGESARAGESYSRFAIAWRSNKCKCKRLKELWGG